MHDGRLSRFVAIVSTIVVTGCAGTTEKQESPPAPDEVSYSDGSNRRSASDSGKLVTFDADMTSSVPDEVSGCIPACPQGFCGNNGCGSSCACSDGWQCSQESQCICAEVIWVAEDSAEPGVEDGTKDHPYASLAAALEGACPGATIRILPGQLSGGVVVDVPYVRIAGSDQSEVTISGPADGTNMLILADGVGLSDLTLAGGRRGVAVTGKADSRLHSIALERVRVTNLQAKIECPDAAYGVCAEQLDGVLLDHVDGATIMNCKFDQFAGGGDDSDTVGVRLEGCADTTVGNCTIAGLSGAGSSGSGGSAIGISVRTSTDVVIQSNWIETISSGHGFHGGGAFAKGIEVITSEGIQVLDNQVEQISGKHTEGSYSGKTAGIRVSGSSCSARGNTIRDITGGSGGIPWPGSLPPTAGVVFSNSSGELLGNTISGITGSCVESGSCSAEFVPFGSSAVGIHIANSSLLEDDQTSVSNNLVAGVRGGDGWVGRGKGHGMLVEAGGELHIRNNTIASVEDCTPFCPPADAVEEDVPTAGVSFLPGLEGSCKVENNIFSEIEGYGMLAWGHADGDPTPQVAYNNVFDCQVAFSETLLPDSSNYYFEPHFQDTSTQDYHLLPTSLCIDAGAPDTPCSNEPAPNGCRVNLGAYGNTDEATPEPGVQHCGNCPQ